jgi:hypothetical protein
MIILSTNYSVGFTLELVLLPSTFLVSWGGVRKTHLGRRLSFRLLYPTRMMDDDIGVEQ